MVQEYTEFIKSEILSTILPCNGIPNKWELYVYTSVKDKFTYNENWGNYTRYIIWMQHPSIRKKFTEI